MLKNDLPQKWINRWFARIGYGVLLVVNVFIAIMQYIHRERMNRKTDETLEAASKHENEMQTLLMAMDRIENSQRASAESIRKDLLVVIEENRWDTLLMKRFRELKSWVWKSSQDFLIYASTVYYSAWNWLLLERSKYLSKWHEIHQNMNERVRVVYNE